MYIIGPTVRAPVGLLNRLKRLDIYARRASDVGRNYTATRRPYNISVHSLRTAPCAMAARPEASVAHHGRLRASEDHPPKRAGYNPLDCAFIHTSAAVT